jgi:hypothetical protein
MNVETLNDVGVPCAFCTDPMIEQQQSLLCRLPKLDFIVRPLTAS